MTKSYKFKKNLFFWLSFLSTMGPILVFTIMGLLEAETGERACLTITALAAIFLSVIAAMRKIHLRSTLFILIIGLWIALENILPFLITIGICTMFDELLFAPLYKRFKEDYHTNLQLDKRLGDKNG